MDVIKQRFAKVFKGLGKLGEDTTKLKGVTPYSLYTPRKVPLPLRKQVKEELEAMGVISKVDQPTPWCAGMVVVPKRSGAVRVCVDLKPLTCYIRSPRSMIFWKSFPGPLFSVN